jgi:hypothetical protein
MRSAYQPVTIAAEKTLTITVGLPEDSLDDLQMDDARRHAVWEAGKMTTGPLVDEERLSYNTARFYFEVP